MLKLSTLRKLAVPLLSALVLLQTDCTRQEVPTENTELDLSRARELFGVSLERPAAVNKDAVIAKVDDRDITQADLNLEAAKLLRSVRQPIPPERVAQARQQIVNKAMENLVVSALLLNAVEQENMAIPEEDIADALQQMKASLDPDTTWEGFLSSNKLTVAKIESKITQDLRLSKLINQKTTAAAPPTEEAIRKFYDDNLSKWKLPEAVEVQQVLIKVKDKDAEATRIRKRGNIEKIHRQLVAGADFSQVAAQAGMPNEGRIGVVYKGKSFPEFEAVAFKLEPGAVSEVLTTKIGHHILRVTKKIPARTVPFEEARSDILTFLSKQDQQQAMQAYIKELRDAATIEFIKK